jgi:glycosyltransferase involved in cell wall biosynthesis
MKSLLLTPTFFPKLTGNAVTVHRIAEQLTQAGITCKILNLSCMKEKTLIKDSASFEPDIIHNFHAWKSGPCGLKIKKTFGIPMITTMTGTDVNIDIKTPEKKEVIGKVLDHSDVITVFNEQARAILLKQGRWNGKIAVIHQSVLVPAPSELDYRKVLQIDPETTVFLLLGAIRRIKNFSYAIHVLERVKKIFPQMLLIIAGPVIEPDEFTRLGNLIRGKKWIDYIGEVPRENIASLLTSVDVVLNTSDAESESNTILEALSFGKIVIGRAIAGNSSILTKQTGFTFNNRRECYESVIYVLNHLGQLDNIGQQAKRCLEEIFNFTREQAGYLAIYHKLKLT